MDVGLADLIGILIIYFGIKVIIGGKIEVETGITDGAKYNAKFTKSVKTTFTGTAARLKGVAFCVLGILIILFLPDENTFFTIPFDFYGAQ